MNIINSRVKNVFNNKHVVVSNFRTGLINIINNITDVTNI